ncbi:MAG: division/cell wall cluster transcriptional repressor MraZ [Candidatus Marinimicrobia bacterium]|jgi:MraZ protein|nr:division/cell wall cluster transcriptional repressor MraZ [Candidatus Neomarinimicrobiota bacterium]MCK9483277.1 division/cell wall cluster transcriptional repressor MraZ [Candidatus Neomarinimicrobiota bacterium]MCK9559543.1 division/cell wall cluster transcriptional repressor MraZ [Candidatus Neomarinimicrobiota bacterium]MDD5061407.1 division/cell wall cluster transcriptional repressor MraZ [Candidatus Neomarinimicrobiota bacterium]MDD5229807.1 division/cell wall cluster transcriptional r
MITAFAGETCHPLDDKNRLSIPAKYRRWLADEDTECTFVVTKGSDPCLVCYPATEWDTLSEKLLKLSYFKKKNRAFIRALARSSVRLKCDGQGRILIPPTLLEYANIKKDVIIIGALNRLELWDPQTLAQHEESTIPLDDEYFEDLGDIL